jgi:hypothetical protein
LKKDLCTDLVHLGVKTRGKTSKEVQEMALLRNLTISEEQDDILEGWVGKQKGINTLYGRKGCLIQIHHM